MRRHGFTCPAIIHLAVLSLSLPGEFLYAPACICALVSQYDLGASIAELKGKKASDFIDKSLLNELESEGFFAGLQGQKTR
jgi:hypothetical protein